MCKYDVAAITVKKTVDKVENLVRGKKQLVSSHETINESIYRVLEMADKQKGIPDLFKSYVLEIEDKIMNFTTKNLKQSSTVSYFLTNLCPPLLQ